MSVADVLANSQTLIDDLRGDAVEAASALEALTGRLTWYDFASTTSLELNKAPTVISDSDFPSLEKVSFDVSIGEFDPNAYKANVYDSEFFTFLEPYLTTEINNGGPGISSEVQDALWNDQNERDIQLLDDSLDRVRTNYGKTAFPLPTQVLRGQENELITKYQFDRANRNREITALIAERAQDFVKHAISAGTNMEEARMRFALGFADLYNTITAAMINRFKAEQEARVVEFEGEVKVILSKLEVGKINSQLDLAYQEQLLKQWEIETTQSLERTKALMAQNFNETQTRLGASKGLTDFYASLSSSAATQVTGIVSESENTETTI